MSLLSLSLSLLLLFECDSVVILPSESIATLLLLWLLMVVSKAMDDDSILILGMLSGKVLEGINSAAVFAKDVSSDPSRIHTLLRRGSLLVFDDDDGDDDDDPCTCSEFHFVD